MTVDTNAYLLAKCYFDAREYERAAHVLRGKDDHKSIFLQCYATYLAGEKLKAESSYDAAGIHTQALNASKSENKHLSSVYHQLDTLYQAHKLDAFGLFLYGNVLRERGRLQPAINVLVQSVNQYPLNWSAWECLASCYATIEAFVVHVPKLPDSFVTLFHEAHVLMDMHIHMSVARTLLLELNKHFPNSVFLKQQYALWFYNKRDFNECIQTIQHIQTQDPFQLECMDTYSSTLFVEDRVAELSMLARRCVDIDPFRPETCFVFGNYYSRLMQHDKAIGYFNRALRLNPSFNAAWTLMGHEYLECKNWQAAIECYRRAIDACARDYRAYYGLGQTYDLLGMQEHAIVYYQRAIALRPYDARIWYAIGECYMAKDQVQDALRAYRRAEYCGEHYQAPPDVHVDTSILTDSTPASIMQAMEPLASVTVFDDPYHVWMAIKKLVGIYRSQNAMKPAMHYASKLRQLLLLSDMKEESIAKMFLELAPVVSELGHVKQALEYTDMALLLTPDDDEALVMRLYHMQTRYKEKLTSAESVVELSQSSMDMDDSMLA